jgi:hypothetical protein
MAQRRMVIRSIDPFTVLRFGAVANLAVAAIGLVAAAILVRVVLGSGLVDQVCDIAGDVGFADCGVEQGRVLRLLLALALLWAVVQTLLLVLLAFLYNLIADLVGGVAVRMDIDGPSGRGAQRMPSSDAGSGFSPGPGGPGSSAAGPAPGIDPRVVARPGPAGPDDETTTVAAVDGLEAIVAPRPTRRLAPESGGRLFGDR